MKIHLICVLLIMITAVISAQTVTLSTDNVTIDEGNGTATLTATVSTTVGSDITVVLSVSGDVTAADYSLATSIVITAGELTGTATVTAVDDYIDELDESMAIDIDSVTNATESGTQQVTIDITDNDDPPSVLLLNSDELVSEDLGQAQFIAIALGISDRDMSVTLGFSGTAILDTDYSISSDTIIIPAGNTVAGMTVFVTSDTDLEIGETVIADIIGVTNCTETGTQKQTITILDNDSTPTVTLTVSTDAIVNDSGISTVTATLSQMTANTVTVNLGGSGTAVSGTAYTLSSASIVIDPGETIGTSTVTSIADPAADSDETVILDIDTVVGASESSPQQVTITITDDGGSGGGSSGCCFQRSPDHFMLGALIAAAVLQGIVLYRRKMYTTQSEEK